jgi:hypothetical protein
MAGYYGATFTAEEERREEAQLGRLSARRAQAQATVTARRSGRADASRICFDSDMFPHIAAEIISAASLPTLGVLAPTNVMLRNLVLERQGLLAGHIRVFSAWYMGNAGCSFMWRYAPFASLGEGRDCGTWVGPGNPFDECGDEGRSFMLLIVLSSAATP